MAGEREAGVPEVATWGDFEVHFSQVLGRGGMGAVYKARQRSLDRWVAIKVLDTSRAPDPELAQGFLERFQVEARALGRLQDPRIVTILQAGQNGGRYWFAMELIDGETVEQRLFREGAFLEAEVRRVGAEVARALDAAWRQRITHRDVKPANVFLCRDGAVKLGDFGLARGAELARTKMTDAQAVACTPAYASPEQAEGRATDHRSDLYSLGCVLYEMCTERPPFAGGSQMETLFRQAQEPPPPPRLLNPKVSAEFEAVLFKCLEKDPDDRYQSYGELLRALEPPPAGERREWFWPAAAAAGLALLGAILTAIFLNADTPPREEVNRLSPPPKAMEVSEVLPLIVPPPPQALAPPPPPPAPPPEEPATVLLAPHRPAPAEIEFVGRILAASRETLEERSAWRFDRARERLAALGRQKGLTNWAAEILEAERARVSAAEKVAREKFAFRSGQEVSLVLRDGRTVRGRVAAAGAETLSVDLPTGMREDLPRAAVAPVTFEDALEPRAGAGDARGVVGRFGDTPHAPGVVDQAIEEALRAGDRGDVGALLGLEIPGELRESLAPILEARLRLFDEERAAAELYGRGDVEALLTRRSLTRAGILAAAQALAEFRKSLPKDGLHELVGQISFGGWAQEFMGVPGEIRYQPGGGAYVLSAPELSDRAWIKKRFKGARKGYEVRFRFGSLGDPRLVVALSTTRLFHVAAGSVELFRSDEGGPFRPTGGVALGRPIAGGRVGVFPKESLVLVTLEDRLLFALPGSDWALDEGIKLAAGGGTVLIESIRVKDRTRD